MDLLERKFLEIGCPATALTSLYSLVYADLTEVKKYHDVDFKYNSVLKSIYFLGRQSKQTDLVAFLPVHCNNPLTFDQMQTYIAQLCVNDVKRLYLVICSSDSTKVYYEISNGIGSPCNK